MIFRIQTKVLNYYTPSRNTKTITLISCFYIFINTIIIVFLSVLDLLFLLFHFILLSLPCVQNNFFSNIVAENNTQELYPVTNNIKMVFYMYMWVCIYIYNFPSIVWCFSGSKPRYYCEIKPRKQQNVIHKLIIYTNVIIQIILSRYNI